VTGLAAAAAATLALLAANPSLLPSWVERTPPGCRLYGAGALRLREALPVWGSFRPGLYIGVGATAPRSLKVGVAWFDPDSNLKRVRTLPPPG
jgi:hypothetical protein